jgi:hypothetical protein
MAKERKKVKTVSEIKAKKLAKLRKKPGMSNAGKYPNVPKDEFAGPSGTYPINTLKRAKSAEILAGHSPHQASILNKIYDKYPQLEEESVEAKKKKSPVAYNSSPFPLKQERDKRKKGKKYKTGSLIDETDWESHNTGLNVQDINAIEEDKKGQFITSVRGEEGPYADPKRQDTIRPTKGRHFKMTWGEKERNFTPKPNRK